MFDKTNNENNSSIQNLKIKMILNKLSFNVQENMSLTQKICISKNQGKDIENDIRIYYTYSNLVL